MFYFRYRAGFSEGLFGIIAQTKKKGLQSSEKHDIVPFAAMRAVKQSTLLTEYSVHQVMQTQKKQYSKNQANCLWNLCKIKKNSMESLILAQDERWRRA